MTDLRSSLSFMHSFLNDTQSALDLKQAQTTGDLVTYVLLSPSRSSQVGRCICSMNQSFGAAAVLWMMQLLKLCPLASAMAQQTKCLTLTELYNDKKRSKIKAESLKEKKKEKSPPKVASLDSCKTASLPKQSSCSCTI